LTSNTVATAGGTDYVQPRFLTFEARSFVDNAQLSLSTSPGSYLTFMWNNTDIPLAYLISFRTYGTWLHGDQRGSIDRFHNRYGSPYLAVNSTWHSFNQQSLKTKPLILNGTQRRSVKAAISETCWHRKWLLLASSVRTNHVHGVVRAHTLPERVLNALKANATRQLRVGGLWTHCFSPWADKGSLRWLWNEQSVTRAVDYVLYGQGDELPDFDD